MIYSNINLHLKWENIFDAYNYYADLGFDTIPLLPGTKKTDISKWQGSDPQVMWKNAPSDSNIGIRAGGRSRVAILDFDDKNHFGTVQNGLNWLDGLGYKIGDYPLIQTASGVGRQVYVTFSGELPGNIRNFIVEFGAGEFRYGPGSYVVAPPSIVGESGYYKLLSGNFSNCPIIDTSDIKAILSLDASVLSQPRLPRGVYKMLQGRFSKTYNSRSEAEQAIITVLCNAKSGISSFAFVKSLFDKYPCAGKYREMKSESLSGAENWLRRSYERALVFSDINSSMRNQIITLITNAEKCEWKGRTGLSDKALYLAHLQIASEVCRFEYAASIRRLADIAGRSKEVAIESTHRLIGLGLIIKSRDNVADKANWYKLLVCQNAPISSPPTCEEVVEVWHK